MLDKQVLNVYSGEYEDHRTAKKLNHWQIFLTVFKSASRLSLFGFHQVFQKSGIWLGLLVSGILVYCLNHACLRLVTFAEELERESLDSLRVENSFELVELMEIKYLGKSWVGTVLFFLTLFSATSFTLGMYITCSTIFVDMMGMGVFASNLLMFIILCGLLIFALEPEQIIVITYPVTVISVSIVVVCSYFGVKELAGKNGVSPHVKNWDFKDIGLSCGYVISSIELVNNILNYRRMMARGIQSDFRRTGYLALYLVGVQCIFPSLILYLAYQNRGLQDFYFRTFLDSQIIKVLYCCFSLNMILGALKYSIFSIEMLEKLKYFQGWLRNDKHELSTGKVFSLRLTYLVLTMILAYFLSDIRKVYSITGIYFNSFIALIIPAGLSFIRPDYMKATDSKITKASDLLALSVGCFTIAIYVIQTLF